MADTAFEHGACRRDFSGSFRRYLDDQYYSKAQANNMRVYAEHLWLFANTDLITVWRVPHEFISAANRAMKREAALLI
jgi:hypothetical protein